MTRVVWILVVLLGACARAGEHPADFTGLARTFADVAAAELTAPTRVGSISDDNEWSRNVVDRILELRPDLRAHSAPSDSSATPLFYINRLVLMRDTAIVEVMTRACHQQPGDGIAISTTPTAYRFEIREGAWRFRGRDVAAASDTTCWVMR